jgi:uncharacterized protein YjdB
MTRLRLAWVWIIALMVAVASGCGDDSSQPGTTPDASDVKSDVPPSDARTDATDARSDALTDAPVSDTPGTDTGLVDTRVDAVPDVRIDTTDGGQPPPDAPRDQITPPPDSPLDQTPDQTPPPPDAPIDGGSCANDTQCPVSAPHCNTTTGACVSVSSIGVTPANPSIANGTTQQFQATFIYSDNSTGSATAQATWSSSDMSKATIASGGLATALAAGTTTITATVGTLSHTTTLTITAATLSSIAVTPTNPTNALGTTRQFTATGTFSDGTTQDLTTQATWTSATTSVATINAAGLATTLAAGTSVITAATGGRSGSTTLTVSGATLVSLAITPSAPTIALQTSVQLQVTGTYTDNTTQDLTTQATWSSSNASIATVGNTAGTEGHATGIAIGTSTISAAVGAVTGTTVLTVTSASLQSISITPLAPSVAKGTSVAFTATGTYSDTTTQDLTTLVAWTSSDTNVAVISNAAGTQGNASAANVGVTTITAVSGGVTGTTTLTVTNATLVSIGIAPVNPSIAKGTTQAFTATGTYTDNTTQNLTTTVTWSSSDTAVAPISNAGGSEGLATGQNQGSATITATLGAVTQSTTLTVTTATLTAVAVTPPNPSLPRGLDQQFVATGTYSDNSTQDLTASATWGSSDGAIATISNAVGTQGLAHGAAAGTVTISATVGGFAATTQLTVTSATLVSIQVTPPTPSIAKGTTQQFTATGTYTDSTTQDLTALATWSSSDSNVGAISNASGSEGLATGSNTGAATITAAYGGHTGTATLTVTAATLVSLAVTPPNPSIAKGLNQQFAATGTYSDNTTQDLTASAAWSSSDGAIATISNAVGTEGLANGAAPGTVTISAAVGGVAGTTSLTVTSATVVSIQVTPPTPSIAKGTTQQFTATGTFTDSTTQDVTALATWSSSDSNVGPVSNAGGSEGLATGSNTGVATITAAYGGQSGTATLTVTAATLVSLAVTPPNPSIAKGLNQQFAATGTYSDNTTQDLTASAAWSSSNNTIATISSAVGTEGLANGATPGTVTITATIGAVVGTTQLTVTSATLVSIQVTPPTPSIAKGTTQQFTATGTYTDSTTQDLTALATWSSSDSNVGPISNAAGSQGLANGSNTGATTITAAYSGKTGVAALTVTAATLVSIAVSPPNSTIAKGTTTQFQANGTYTDMSVQDITQQVNWASSNNAFASVSNGAGSEGLATAIAIGTVNVTATLGAIVGTTPLTVSAATLVSLQIDPPNPTILKGNAQQFTATGTYTDNSTQDLTAPVTWSSSATGVATISNVAGSHGLATSVAPGITTITATLGAVTTTTTLTVDPATLVSIAVTPATPSVAKGTTVQYTATGTYSDASSANITTLVSWSSSSGAVATISNAAGTQGLASTLGVGGPITITATLGAVAGTAQLSVTAAALTSITIAPTTAAIPVGFTVSFVATGHYSDASTQDLTAQAGWSSSNNTFATVANGGGNKGRATAVAAGTVTITAAFGGMNGTAQLTVTTATLVSIAVTPASSTINNGATLQYTATGTYSDANTYDITGSVNWSSTNVPAGGSPVAQVSNAAASKGLATGQRGGDSSIRATLGAIFGTTPLHVNP